MITKDISIISTSPWQLFKMALPLMLTALSTSLMVFFDRLVLSNFSYHAMNSVLSASTVITVFQYSFLTLTTIATVFVGKYNGAKDYHLVGTPVWQMIWFAAFSSILFIILGMCAGPFFIYESFHDAGIPYYQIVMSFGFFISLIGALSSFFVGIGQTKIITTVAIVANVVNLVLDVILVFGLFPGVPPMGTMGAAIATVFSQLIQIIVLGAIFLNKSNRTYYKTLTCKLNLSLMLQCFKIGVPSSISHLIEFSAWALVVYMIGGLGDEYVFVFSIGHSLFILLAFASEGLQKVTTSIASNAIGAKQSHLISKLLKSSIKVHLAITIIFMLPSVIMPDVFIGSFSIVNDEPIDPALYNAIYITLIAIWCYFIIDGIAWIFVSILTAFEDTLIPMLINALSSWLVAILPIYYFVVKQKGEPELIWIITCIYAMSVLGFCSIRYRFKTKN